jgi:hypothetical protein
MNKAFFKNVKSLMLIVISAGLSLISCVQGDLYELYDDEFSDHFTRKKTKQDIYVDTQWWQIIDQQNQSSYISNECAAWAMMQLFCLSDGQSLNRVRAALCLSYSVHMWGYISFSYNDYVSICNAMGFFPENMVEASLLLTNAFGGSYRQLTKNSGYTSLNIEIGIEKDFPENTYIVGMSNHCGVLLCYRKNVVGNNYNIHYKDYNHTDTKVSLSNVLWVVQ